jgi:hypothetical protein
MRTKTKAHPNKAVILAALSSLLLVGNSEIGAAAQPAASAPLRGEGQATTFRVSGSIDQVYRKSSKIFFFADAPFWGPSRYGYGRASLWPKDTLFVLHVPTVPITIDGKKASFEDLVPGQKIQVQYNLEENGGIRCIAHRIDARGAPASLSLSGQPHPAPLIGHWRYAGPGLISDYVFAANGTFIGELAEAGDRVRHFSGTWSVAGDKLNYLTTKSELKYTRAGTKDQDRIIQLTKDYYVVESSHGNHFRFTRLPK